jgi:competence protein ComEC
LRDIGFQLSVLATAGILLIGAPVNDWFLSKTTRPQNPIEVNTWWRNVGELVLITFAAQVATLPVLLYHFQRFPVVGLLVNPLVLPVQPAAMTLGGIAVIAGLVNMPLGKILGLLAWLPLVYTTRMVELFAGLGRTGSMNVSIGVWQAVSFGLFLTMAIIFWKQWTSRIRQFFFPAAFAILTASLALLLNTITLYPDGNLHMEVYRQGSDLTTFIHSPGGQRILVTNRPGDKDLSAFVDRRLPILDRRLDAIIIPNPTTNSSNGLGWTVSRYQPDWILINRQAGGFRVRSRLDEELAGVGFVGTDFATGQQFALGSGALLSVLSVGEKGSVVYVVWGSQKIVLMYGEQGKVLEKLRDEEIDVIVMDHPGESINTLKGRLIIFTNSGNQNAAIHFEVADGSWVEIESDGRLTQILEPVK